MICTDPDQKCKSSLYFPQELCMCVLSGRFYVGWWLRIKRQDFQPWGSGAVVAVSLGEQGRWLVWYNTFELSNRVRTLYKPVSPLQHMPVLQLWSMLKIILKGPSFIIQQHDILKGQAHQIETFGPTEYLHASNSYQNLSKEQRKSFPLYVHHKLHSHDHPSVCSIIIQVWICSTKQHSALCQ